MAFTLQILHASDLEGGVDAISNAPNFATIVEALEAEAADAGHPSILLSAGDNYIPGPFFNAGGDFSLSNTYEGFYNALFGLIDESALDAADDTDGNGFFDNAEIEAAIRAGTASFDAVYTTDINGDGFRDYFEEIDTQEGRVDIAIMNALGFDASAVGNHEFDAGTDYFENIINYDSEEGNGLSGSRYDDAALVPGHVNYLQEIDTPGAQFPYLSANLDFSGDFDVGPLFSGAIQPASAFASDLLSARVNPDDPAETGADSNDIKGAPATVLTVDGERIGVVGATTQLVSQISSTGAVADATSPGVNDMAALAAALQPFVDELTASGIDKIVIVSHLQQFALEQELASLMTGVDVIIAGGSDTISADAQDRLREGAAAEQPYPLIVEDAEGNPTAVVSTDGEYRYVGRLVVTFDEDGNIVPGSIDEDVSGAFATDEQGVLDVTGADSLEAAIAGSEAGADVAALTGAVTDVVIAADSTAFGESTVYIEGSRSAVRTEETTLGNLTADANIFAAQAVDPAITVSIKNGGGIRASIGEVDSEGNELPTQANPVSGKEEGEISLLDIQNALRFDNGLVAVETTPEGLKIVLEHAVAATAEGATPGQFAQVGGLRFSFDPEAPAQELTVIDGTLVTLQQGERIRSVEIDLPDGSSLVIVENGEVDDDAPESIKVVTLDFLAGGEGDLLGGDGYPWRGVGTVTDLEIGEQDALADYLAATFPVDGDDAFSEAETGPEADSRIQNLGLREDDISEPGPVEPVDVPVVPPFEAVLGSGELAITPVVTFQGAFETDGDAEGASEVVNTIDGMLYVTNGNIQTIDIFDIAAGETAGRIQLSDLPGFDGVQSVAVNEEVIVAVVDVEPTDGVPNNGMAAIYDRDSLELITTVETGNLPDSVTFTHDGSRALIANEGEFNSESDLVVDAPGGVTVVDLSDLGAVTATTVDFSGAADLIAAAATQGLRLNPEYDPVTDLEPEYIAVAPDDSHAYVSLQEANAFAVLDLETLAFTDIITQGTRNHWLGDPELTTVAFTDLPLLGTDANGLDIDLGGFSGLWFDGAEADGTLNFLTVPDRGPNGSEVVEGARTFNLPDYQARVVAFSVDPSTGEATIGNQIFFTDGAGNPITGLPNHPALDETPVDAAGNPLDYDPLGADMEGIVRAGDGTFWTVDEYRPAIYHFDTDGTLIDRFVPAGTAAAAGEEVGSFGTESLPEAYFSRVPNRGFEAMAIDEASGILYAFIQTPLANPDKAASDASGVIRILGIDIATGEPVAEHVYLLEDPSAAIRAGGRVDKIGDAVFRDLGDGTGEILVIERDGNFGSDADKNVFSIILDQATNLIADQVALPAGETLEQQSAADLAALGIEPVAKSKLFGVPEIGYTPSDKTEGLALIQTAEGEAIALLNDNDFGIEDSAGLVPQLGIVTAAFNAGFDATDDGVIDIVPRQVLGLRMADAIAAAEIGGITYLLSANEGDGRGDAFDDGEAVPFGDEARVGDLLELGLIDEAVNTDGLERLVVSTIDGDTDGDGDIDVLHSFGSRSFTIFDSAGNVVFDSGSEFERYIAANFPERFNDDDGGLGQNRSDAKGPEPEALAVGEVDGRTYAFIGAERDSGVFVYNVSEPENAYLVDYIDGFGAGNIAPETIAFIPADESSSGKAQIAVAYEISGTTAVFDLDLDTGVATVEDFYDVALGRQFDAAGLNFWSEVYETASIEFVSEAFDLSTEFNAAIDGLSDLEGLNLVANNALGRDATEAEQEAFLPIIAEDGYDQVFLAFIEPDLA
ncbi:hypothetical protein LNKW23_05700 [Paralimibaculum aggregatum]|uniref:Trifunctional nucleotide phosphoesterase protein YfkN n=1 Tax=Paralimibaculum aggregatum TaxID=3036245 RepID=A0ABQ6LEG1_9RHOB|nr:esterase-like activity of phytase family protein [Limibaculum sp. NKW23]GMG81357.1 hypothetical protein LNKW23_05700 [Limibaculum sp. NKW23]